MGNKETEKKDIFAEINEELKREEEKVALATKIADEIKPILTDLNTSERKSLIYYIRLGEILFKAKIALGESFKKLITDKGLVSPKQVQRYIRLCLARESMDAYGACKTSAQFKALKLDARVTKLTEDGIKNFTDATQANINRMKFLKNDDLFKKVIDGDSKTLKEPEHFIKKPQPEKPEKTPDSKQKPGDMPDERFKELYNTDMYLMIQKLYKAEKDVKTLEDAEEAAMKAATEHRLKLDNERKKLKKEKALRKKAEEELNRTVSVLDKGKAPIDQQQSIQ